MRAGRLARAVLARPGTVALLIASARVGLGTVCLAAPLRAARLAGAHQEADRLAVALRMFGGRDLALGLGALLAARRGPGALRGWTEASALVDLADAVAMAAPTARSVPVWLRLGAIASATSAGLLGLTAARTLTAKPQPASRASREHGGA